MALFHQYVRPVPGSVTSVHAAPPVGCRAPSGLAGDDDDDAGPRRPPGPLTRRGGRLDVFANPRRPIEMSPVETAVAGADEDRASSSRTAREWGVTHDGAMGWVRRERDASADAASLAMRLSILGIGTLRWESRRRFLASRRVLLASTRSPARPRSLGRAR